MSELQVGERRLAVRFDPVRLGRLDKATWDGMTGRYWSFPVYLAPTITACCYEEALGATGTFEPKAEHEGSTCVAASTHQTLYPLFALMVHTDSVG